MMSFQIDVIKSLSSSGPPAADERVINLLGRLVQTSDVQSWNCNCADVTGASQYDRNFFRGSRLKYIGLSTAALFATLLGCGTQPEESGQTQKVSSETQSAQVLVAPIKTVPVDASQTTRAARAPAVRLSTVSIELPVEALRNEAQTVVAEVRKHFQNSAETLHLAAVLAAQTHQTVEAEKLWKQCLESEPDQEMYYVNLAAMAMERGDGELALSTLKQAIDRGFSSADLLFHWGVALSDAGRFTEAIEVMQNSLRSQPNLVSHWLMLGKAQLQNGQIADSEVSLRKAIDLGAATSSAYFALGTACARQGKRGEAAAYLKLYSDSVADTSVDTRERFQSQRVAEMRGTTISVLNEAATIYMRHEVFLPAERLLLRVLALDPSNVAFCRSLSQLYYAQRLLPEERVARERLLELDPHNYGNYVDLAKVCAQLEDLPSAEATLKLAMTLRPDAADAFATLADFYLQAGQLSTARWYVEQALDRQPSVEGYRLLADICNKQLDTASAQAAKQRALLHESGVK